MLNIQIPISGLLSNLEEKSINLYFIMDPLRKKVLKYGTPKPSSSGPPRFRAHGGWEIFSASRDAFMASLARQPLTAENGLGVRYKINAHRDKGVLQQIIPTLRADCHTFVWILIISRPSLWHLTPLTSFENLSSQRDRRLRQSRNGGRGATGSCDVSSELVYP